MATKRNKDREDVSVSEKRVRVTAPQETVEVHKKSIEKILRNDATIISKLDSIIANQSQLDARISNIERALENNNNNDTIDADNLKETIKKIAKALFEDSIYPTQDEYKEATENYLKRENPEFYRKFKKNQWIAYYEKNIYQPLLAAHRSVRGTFTSKVKESMYSVFGNELPAINTQATPSQIQEWKNKSEVMRCYNRLFKKVNPDQPATYMSKIVGILRKENKTPSKMQLAYAISICETYLSPDSQSIQISEASTKPKIIKNLQKFINKDKFSCSDDDSSASTSPRRPSPCRPSPPPPSPKDDGVDLDGGVYEPYGSEDERAVNSLIDNYNITRKQRSI